MTAATRASTPDHSTEAQPSATPQIELARILDKAAGLLPVQGPITALVALNTLQFLEHLPYDEAVVLGGRLYGCEPYLSESRYRDKLAQGRIRLDDLAGTLHDELGASGDVQIAGLCTRYYIRLAMVQYRNHESPPAELRWFIAETDALRKYRLDAARDVRTRFLQETQDWVRRQILPLLAKAESATITGEVRHRIAAFGKFLEQFGANRVDSWSEAEWEEFALRSLWQVCRDGVHGLRRPSAQRVHDVRPRDALLRALGQDSDQLVHEVLIRFCAAYLDQGLSSWPLPHRDDGFLNAFCDLYTQPYGPPQPWRSGLAAELQRARASGQSPLELIEESLRMLGVPQANWSEFLTASLLALRGFAGMIRQIELNPDRVARPIPEGSLVEFLAVRLILDRLAVTWIAHHEGGWDGPLSELSSHFAHKLGHELPEQVEQRAFLVFQVAQVFGWSPGELTSRTRTEWGELLDEIESFSSIPRRRVLQGAFERRYRTSVLDAISVHAAAPPITPKRPRLQAVFCMDDREESFRRQLEELSPDAETYGIAGFFNVPIYFRGAADAHFAPLCPIVMRPSHWVEERVPFNMEHLHRRRAQTRKVFGSASYRVQMGSRSFATGAFIAAGFGVLASVPLVARVMFPRVSSLLWRTAGSWMRPPQTTRLTLERAQPQPSNHNGGLGFTLVEMSNMSERILRDIGLTGNFARIVMLIGHGSNSVNNPHKAVYDCGACGGGAGGPNARAAATMLNDPRVRMTLQERGITIPADTFFVGALHDTCNDSITYYDVDMVPMSLHDEFENAHHLLEETCERNARERCRRFWSAPLGISPKAALHHVQERAEDLAQTRPEYGHSTTAVVVVGRRGRTRGLFMDRRAFLVSYNPDQDDESGSILLRLMTPAVPVCTGINLQYNFSYTDPLGWGAGSKLPHNVTAMVGVMDGAMSDLRNGLPWQGVEIHEPMRLLFVVETTIPVMKQVMAANPGINQSFKNQWASLAVLDPHSAKIWEYRKGEFHPYQSYTHELPLADTSYDWFGKSRLNLEFARIAVSVGQQA